MTIRDRILAYLADYLRIDTFTDYCINGLQVEGNPVVTKIVTGVSVSERFFQAAMDLGARMLIVHHGLFWKNTPHPFVLSGILKRRVKILLDNDLNLAAYHLPLDAHPKIGNNAQWMKRLHIRIKETVDVGYWGEIETPCAFHEFKNTLDRWLPAPSKALPFGPAMVCKIAIISGGASMEIENIAKLGMDTFLTGDIYEPVPRLAEELGINVLAAGHYNSERFGPMALADHLKEVFGIPVEFIDVDNPA